MQQKPPDNWVWLFFKKSTTEENKINCNLCGAPITYISVGEKGEKTSSLKGGKKHLISDKHNFPDEEKNPSFYNGFKKDQIQKNLNNYMNKSEVLKNIAEFWVRNSL